MVTPRKRRELPPTLNLPLQLIDAFDTDNAELQERRKAFVEAIHFLLLERPQLEQLFKSGRIESITEERNSLVATLDKKDRAINAHHHDKAKILMAINLANQEQSHAKAAFNGLKNNGPSKSRSTDSEWQQYEKALKDAHNDWKQADFKVIESSTANDNWTVKLKELQGQYDAIERQIQVLDYDRDVLTGKIDPRDLNKRVHDPDTGLAIRGPVAGQIRSS